MFKDKLGSVKDHVGCNWPLYGAGAFIAAIIALEVKYPGSITTTEPEIPTMKIIHVHVNE